MRKNRHLYLKRFSALLFVAALLCSSVVIANAATDRKETSINGGNVVSTAYAGRTKATISSMAGSGTGSVQGTHTITYRSQATSSSSMIVRTSSSSFGGTGGTIIKENLYLVDYSAGIHIYNFTGVGSFTVNTKAYY